MPKLQKCHHERNIWSKDAIQDAINNLLENHAAIARDKRDEKRDKRMAWEIIRSTAVTAYLHLRLDDVPKIEASRQVASSLYFKRFATSYKARCIRVWADYFLQFGTLPEYTQGKHIKTPTIITDENVKHFFKTCLRALKDEDRTPQRFMTDLNKEGGLLSRNSYHTP